MSNAIKPIPVLTQISESDKHRARLTVVENATTIAEARTFLDMLGLGLETE